jgi:sterol desaturase/sphingolipid hydroxylase (fatty acid hydroxylase superfamily)
MVLLAISGIAQTLIFRATPVVVAVAVADSRFGILNRPWIPLLVNCAAAILVLDLAHYGMHRAFHSFSLLWRIHEVHHSDPDYDVSTAGRFHPFEVVLMQGGYLALVAVLAPPPGAVFAAELISVVLNLFAHANVRLPRWMENTLRRAIVTPGLHRIHHSQEVPEQMRNFGQTFSWWDRLFGTFLGDAARGEGMVTGIPELRNSASLELGFMLVEPLRRRKADPISSTGSEV